MVMPCAFSPVVSRSGVGGALLGPPVGPGPASGAPPEPVDPVPASVGLPEAGGVPASELVPPLPPAPAGPLPPGDPASAGAPSAALPGGGGFVPHATARKTAPRSHFMPGGPTTRQISH